MGSDLMMNISIKDLGSENYELSVGVDINTGMKFMPSLEIKWIKRNCNFEEYKNLSDLWDSSEYLIEIVLPLLNNYLKDGETKPEYDMDHYHNIFSHVHEEDFETVVDMLELGVKKGFFEEYFKKKHEH